MDRITTDDLLYKADCRYTLVIEIAKRARQIIEHQDRHSPEAGNKPVSAAVREMYEGKLICEQPDTATPAKTEA